MKLMSRIDFDNTQPTPEDYIPSAVCEFCDQKILYYPSNEPLLGGKYIETSCGCIDSAVVGSDYSKALDNHIAQVRTQTCKDE